MGRRTDLLAPLSLLDLGQVFVFAVSLFNEGQIARISELLGDLLGRETAVAVTIALAPGKTPAALIDAARAAALDAAEQEVKKDPGVQHLIKGFDAKIVEGSIMPKIAKGEG